MHAQSNYMKIHILSDLHLEFAPYDLDPSARMADVIVLAGDIHLGLQGLQWACDLLASFPGHVIYVAGNHEFYRHDIGATREAMKTFCVGNPRLHYLDNEGVVIDGVRFLGCTLWTDFELFGEDQIQQCLFDGARSLNDFRVIRNGDGRFTTYDSLELHKESLKWLETKLLEEPYNGASVVVTHHCPSFSSVAPRFQEDPVSACFASRLDHFFGHAGLWIHGHTHDSFDYIKRGTRVICNPRGYTRKNSPPENPKFDQALNVEIDDRQPIVSQAIRVFGTLESATKWIENQSLVFGRPPAELLNDQEGIEAVRKVLNAIEYGSPV